MNTNDGIQLSLWNRSGGTPVGCSHYFGTLRSMSRSAFTDSEKILALMFAVILQIACNWGLGQHMWNLDLQHHIEAIKYNYISEPISIFSVMFGRISFSVTLLRLIGPHDKGKRWAIWFLIIEQILINISTVIIIFVQCGSHVTAMYNPVAREQPGVKCWSPNVQTYYSYFQSCKFSAFLINLI